MKQRALKIASLIVRISCVVYFWAFGVAMAFGYTPRIQTLGVAFIWLGTLTAEYFWPARKPAGITYNIHGAEVQMVTSWRDES